MVTTVPEKEETLFLAFVAFASSWAVVATEGVWPSGVAPLLRLRTTWVLLKMSAGEDSTPWLSRS